MSSPASRDGGVGFILFVCVLAGVVAGVVVAVLLLLFVPAPLPRDMWTVIGQLLLFPLFGVFIGIGWAAAGSTLSERFDKHDRLGLGYVAAFVGPVIFVPAAVYLPASGPVVAAVAVVAVLGFLGMH